MKKTSFVNVSNNTLSGLIEAANSIENQIIDEQRTLIEKYSPYSDTINQNIGSYEELRFYCSIGLIEANVTRRSLIRNVNLNLYISSKGKNNLDLMLGGNPPYAFDKEDGIIVLHHIGQKEDSPFAELTYDEHMSHGNNKKLHQSVRDSWRNTPEAEKLFDKERSLYWQMRAREEIQNLRFPCEIPQIDNNVAGYASPKEVLNTMARLFAESSSSDLWFISDSARTYALLKEVGARTFSEFATQIAPQYKKMCIHCGSEEYQAYGTYIKNGEKIQRYKCKDCGLTFTPIQKTIISESNLSFVSWINFINCLYHGKSVATTAMACNISEKSVQNNRLRLFYALKLLDDTVKLSGKIVIDETYFHVSYKGNRSQSKNFSIERKPHRRGSDNHTRGLSKEFVCVECALDENGNSVARIAGTGAPNHYKIQRALKDCISPTDTECIFSDKEKALKKYADVNGYVIKQARSPRKKIKVFDPSMIEVQRWIQKINAFHSRMERFMRNFAGISSDMLYGYLCLFNWIDRNRGRDLLDAYNELFCIMLQPNLYKSLDEIATMPCFSDIITVSSSTSKMYIRNLATAKVIYAKYASGEKIKNIAQEYNCSCDAIRKKINKMDKLGYGYKTEKEKRKEAMLNQPFMIKYPYENTERNRQIYNEKKDWSGTVKEFYQMATKKYGLSKQRIKNIISEEKRILSLYDNINITHHFQHKELFDVYQAIYNDYIKSVNNGVGKCKTVRNLAEQYNYAEITIWKIIKQIKNNDIPNANSKTKMAKNETQNRDKAIFVEFLRWEGSKHDFCIWASKKYRLHLSYVYHILQLHFVAVPKRYEMTYDYSRQHKG